MISHKKYGVLWFLTKCQEQTVVQIQTWQNTQSVFFSLYWRERSHWDFIKVLFYWKSLSMAGPEKFCMNKKWLTRTLSLSTVFRLLSTHFISFWNKKIQIKFFCKNSVLASTSVSLKGLYWKGYVQLYLAAFTPPCLPLSLSICAARL